MINQTARDNYLQTQLATTQLIDMPSKFTSQEANYYKQLLQDLDLDRKPVATNSCNTIYQKMMFNFEKTISIDKGGLAGLCQIVKLAQKNKIDLAFSKFSPEIKIVLSLIGLEELLPITE